MPSRSMAGHRCQFATRTGQTGNPVAAQQLFRELLPGAQRVFGPDHPDTRRIEEWLTSSQRPPPHNVFYRPLLRETRRGRVTPFLGAGVNLCGRPPSVPFRPDEWLPGKTLPSVKELARHLAREFDYPPEPYTDLNLARIAQWVTVTLGYEALYAELHDIFARDYQPTAMHRTLARLPDLVERQARPEYPLIITTNYDDALEKALTEEGVEFDLLTYVATGEYLGRFRHDLPDGRAKVIFVPKKYDAVSLQQRTVVVKVNGSVMRYAAEHDEDSYVVSEDDFTRQLERVDIIELLPWSVVTRMQHCHYLFLGYTLQDWNLRAILHRIRRDRALNNASWVVQPNFDMAEEKAWQERNVERHNISLEEFAQALDGYITSEMREAGSSRTTSSLSSR